MDVISVARCDDCGALFAVGRTGGPIPECCAPKGGRRVSAVTFKAPEWRQLPNPRRDTVDGPPTLAWIQGTDSYGLYANGEHVATLAGIDVGPDVTIINEILAKATKPEVK